MLHTPCDANLSRSRHINNIAIASKHFTIKGWFVILENCISLKCSVGP